MADYKVNFPWPAPSGYRDCLLQEAYDLHNTARLIHRLD
jgi:hypothetical protein